MKIYHFGLNQSFFFAAFVICIHLISFTVGAESLNDNGKSLEGWGSPHRSETTITSKSEFGRSLATCEDKKGFKDFVGLDCEQHAKTPDCSKIWIVGYSFSQVEKILKNCPYSCRLCDRTTQGPSSRPTPNPTTFPTYNPTLAPTPVCHDDKSFRDRLGFKCSEHKNRGSGCMKLSKLGYNKRNMVDLRKKCPRSCGLCITTTPTAYPTTAHPTSICDDDTSYFDHLGLSCDRFSKEICVNVIVLGYTKGQSKELNTRCPMSCGHCDSEAPSSVPSTNYPSDQPTRFPSLSPSSFPSDIPSTKPSIWPTSQPTQIPTMFPTLYPTTSPTVLPTAMPTPQCHDISSFTDKRDFTCNQHKFTPDCSNLGVLGYTERDMAVLMRNCPLSCKLCDSSPPSSVPSIAPSPSSKDPSVLPTVSPSSSCRDNTSYRDPLGSVCIRYSNLICENMHVLGFSTPEVITLINNCPMSCGLCTSSPIFLTDEKSSSNIGYVTQMPSEVMFSRQPSYFPTDKKTDESSLVCVDDPNYKDRLGLTCVDHQHTQKCWEVASIGYSAKEVRVLLASCRHSCNLCDSTSPSNIPSPYSTDNLPYSTDNPTSNISILPTSDPTTSPPISTSSKAPTTNEQIEVVADTFQISIFPFTKELSHESLKKFHLACDDIFGQFLENTLLVKSKIITITSDQRVSAVFNGISRGSNSYFALDLDVQKTLYFNAGGKKVETFALNSQIKNFFTNELQISKLMLHLAELDSELYSNVTSITFIGYQDDEVTIRSQVSGEGQIVEEPLALNAIIYLISGVGGVIVLVVVCVILLFRKKSVRSRKNRGGTKTKSSLILEGIAKKAKDKMNQKESDEESNDSLGEKVQINSVSKKDEAKEKKEDDKKKLEPGDVSALLNVSITSDLSISRAKSPTLKNSASDDTEDTQKTSNVRSRASAGGISLASDKPSDDSSGCLENIISRVTSEDIPELSKIADECNKRITKTIAAHSGSNLEDLLNFKKKGSRMGRSASTTDERPLLRDVLGIPNNAIPLKHVRSASVAPQSQSPPSPPPLNSLRNLDRLRSSRRSPRPGSKMANEDTVAGLSPKDRLLLVHLQGKQETQGKHKTSNSSVNSCR